MQRLEALDAETLSLKNKKAHLSEEMDLLFKSGVDGT